MRLIPFTALILSLLALPVQGQGLHGQQLGSFPAYSAPVRGGEEALVSGFVQPNLWLEPAFHDTVICPEGSTSFVFDVWYRGSPYAPFFFDVPAADTPGWYRFRVLEPYRLAAHPDSLYVQFPVPDGGDPEWPGPSAVRLARIVNLVVLDPLGFTRLRVLNLSDYDRVELRLFDQAGRCLLDEQDYRNDFDFSGREPQTYYYRAVLVSGSARLRQDGFIEVVMPD